MKLLVLSFFAVGLACLAADPLPTYTANFALSKAPVQSMGTLTFGPEGILFVGDQIGSAVYAFDTGDKQPGSAEKIDLQDLEAKIGGLLGADAKDVLIHDMAVNPISRNVYLTVSRARQNWNTVWLLPNDVGNANVLLKITPEGKISEVSLDPIAHSKVDLPNPVDPNAIDDWKKTKASASTITDLAYADGKLYVAGLGNDAFNSTMRVANFPFNGSLQTTGLEVYHGAHGAYETNAPVRAFLPYKINGKNALVAAYLCTPLALFPIEDLKHGGQVRGRTVAELGSGNYPLDMVAYQKEGKDFIFILNSQRGPMRVAAEHLASTDVNITERVPAYTGLPFEHLHGSGYLQADNFGSQAIVVLARTQSGSLNLETLPLRRL